MTDPADLTAGGGGYRQFGVGKTLILIHGRSVKPAASVQKRLVFDALMSGLSRVDPLAARELWNGAIDCYFAYYGDINNRLIVQAGDKLAAELTAENDPEYHYAPCLPEAPHRRALNQLMSVQRHDRESYGALLASYHDTRWLDDIARTVSGISLSPHLREYLVKWATADMSEYLHTRTTGSEIRERLQNCLRPALERGSDICLISHSMGAIVSYDVLWKYSHMSEYRHIQTNGNRVSLWLTIGCPLGEPGVRQNLYDARERGEDRFPRRVVRDWVNVAAEDDFVAHDRTMADDFRDMRNLNYVERIFDRRIYNFWVKDGTSDPHNFYGYLDNPEVAASVAGWITGRRRRAFVPPPSEMESSPRTGERAAA
jgi:hypothetical protein